MNAKIKKFYESLGILNNKKEIVNNQLLFKLFDKVLEPKSKYEARTQNITEGHVHQADLLFMPDDDEYKYALVVCDLGSRKTDAEPLKTKNSGEVVEAFRTIYKRNILNFPLSLIQTDPGTEFKNDQFKNYFKDISIRYGKVGRHRMQASIESKNGIIARALFFRMTAQELNTNEKSTEWVEFIPVVIKYLNERLQSNNKNDESTFMKPIRSKEGTELIPEGTIVRVMLDEPKEVYNGQKLHGKFRNTDIRWEQDTTKIIKILLRPDQPPMYLTEKYPSVAYHIEHLQLVDGNEKNPPKSLFKKFVVQKIMDKKKENNRIYYLVKWKGYPNSKNTWEPRTQLIKDVSELIKEYDINNK